MIREVELAVPDEPAAGSVVIDRAGDAWQRRHGNGVWIRVLTVHALLPTTPPGKPWRHLVVDHGRLLVVYVPPSDEPEPAP